MDFSLSSFKNCCEYYGLGHTIAEIIQVQLKVLLKTRKTVGDVDSQSAQKEEQRRLDK